MNKLLTVHEAAQKLDVSVDTIRRWEKKGLIKSARSDHNYRLFSIDELQRVQNKVKGISTVNNYRILKSGKKTKYTSIELFAGAGGTALGLENAGINHILLNEIDKNCVETLKKNRPGWNILHDDV
ncbi:MAG: MerR family DNA-binding transcriptional regulator, partial [Candidatus Daviesbacteria bacterium]|nr:MerR family DNA-binding transcriptional regulator [Candidatus Daviesbacteria bacterium]